MYRNNLSKSSLHIHFFNLSLYSHSIIKIILTQDHLGMNFTFVLVYIEKWLWKSEFIDLWPSLPTTKLSYTQLFKWGHSIILTYICKISIIILAKDLCRNGRKTQGRADPKTHIALLRPNIIFEKSVKILL